MEATLVFPHQLFYPNPSLSKRRKIFLIEDPLFLSDSRYPAVFHKQKIMLHFLSMRSFKEKLNAIGYNVSIIGKNKKSLAFEVILQSKDRTLIENEIEELSQKIISNVTDLTGGSLR